MTTRTKIQKDRKARKLHDRLWIAVAMLVGICSLAGIASDHGWPWYLVYIASVFVIALIIGRAARDLSDAASSPPMIKQDHIVKIRSKMVWVAKRSNDGRWLAWCDEIKLSAWGDTYSELVLCIDEVVGLWFRAMLDVGKLDELLDQRGWEKDLDIPADEKARSQLVLCTPYEIREDGGCVFVVTCWHPQARGGAETLGHFLSEGSAIKLVEAPPVAQWKGPWVPQPDDPRYGRRSRRESVGGDIYQVERVEIKP